MNSWYSKDLGDGVLAQAALAQLQNDFAAACKVADDPARMAVFVRYITEAHLYCKVVVYFSPSCATLATTLDAKRCARPVRDNLSLLAGSDDAWPVLFPNTTY